MRKWMKSRVVAVGLILSLMLAATITWAAGPTTTATRPLPSAVSRTKMDDSSGAFEVVAAVAGKKIQVWHILLTTASASTVEFKSGTNSLTGPMTISAILEDHPYGRTQGDMAFPIFETNAGENFNIAIGGAIRTTGQITYTTYP